jgi:hypothetical protein
LHNGIPPHFATAIAITDSNIYLGTWGAGIYLSTNNCNSWKTIDSTFSTRVGITSIAVSGKNIFVGTYDSGVYYSGNNGTDWTVINNGLTTNNSLSINQLILNGTTIYAVTEGGIYLSVNNGTNWTSLNTLNNWVWANGLVMNGSNFIASSSGTEGMYFSSNYGVNWIPVDSGIAKMNANHFVPIRAMTNYGTSIIIGTDSGVYASSNNGTYWKAYNDGCSSVEPYVGVLGINGKTIYAAIEDTIWKRQVSEIVSGVDEIKVENLVSIFPNPFSDQTTLQANENLKDATLTVYNLVGQQVKQIKNVSGQTITFHRDNLPSGLYFIRMTQDNKIISTDKLVITDN